MSARTGGHHGHMLLRAGMALVGLLVAAWFALSLRNAELTSRVIRDTAATRTARGPAVPGTARGRSAQRAVDEAAAARFLNPDRTAEVYGLVAAFALGERAPAFSRLDAIGRAEPDNVLVWQVMYGLATGSGDSRRVALAQQRLQPLLPRH